MTVHFRYFLGVRGDLGYCPLNAGFTLYVSKTHRRRYDNLTLLYVIQRVMLQSDALIKVIFHRTFVLPLEFQQKIVMIISNQGCYLHSLWSCKRSSKFSHRGFPTDFTTDNLQNIR